jgi:hypothetical protein
MDLDKMWAENADRRSIVKYMKDFAKTIKELP